MVDGLCHFGSSSFCGETTPLEKMKRRKNAMRKDERTKKRPCKKDEIMPCEKMKPATQKDEILARKDAI